MVRKDEKISFESYRRTYFRLMRAPEQKVVALVLGFLITTEQMDSRSEEPQVWPHPKSGLGP